MMVSISQYDPNRANVAITSQNTNLLSQSDKLQSLIKAAGIEEVEPIWTSLFAKVRTHDSALDKNGHGFLICETGS
jgi:hypothetical protein